MVIELPLSRWAERFSPRRVLSAGYVLIGLSCGLLSLARTPRDFFLAMAVFTLGEILALPIGMALQQQIWHRPNTAAATSAFVAWPGAVPELIGSVGVWGYAEIGPVWWLIVGLFAIGAAGVILPGFRDLRAPTPSRPRWQA